MSDLHPKGAPDGLGPLIPRKESDSQYIKMQIIINTTTSAHSVPITLNFSAPIAGMSLNCLLWYKIWTFWMHASISDSLFESLYNGLIFYAAYSLLNSRPSPLFSLSSLSLSLSPQGTNASIGDKWAAEISAEVKKAVASAFDSKYGRRSTMSFTGVSTFILTILPLDLQNRNTHI